MLLLYNEEITSMWLTIAYKFNIYGTKENILLKTKWISHIHVIQYIGIIIIFENVFFLTGIWNWLRYWDVIYIVCELNFKLIFQIRNYIKKSTHAIIINPSLIHRRCSSSLCWCAVFCQFVEIVALLGEYSIKTIYCRFPLLYSFIWKIN